MRAADTNIIVRLIARDDPHQTAAAEAFVKDGVWVSTVVLAEAVWVIANVYKRNLAEQFAIIEGLVAHRSVILEHADAVATALDLFRARPRLGFTDCLILELARRNGHTPLGTFDSALAKVPGAQKVGR